MRSGSDEDASASASGSEVSSSGISIPDDVESVYEDPDGGAADEPEVREAIAMSQQVCPTYPLPTLFPC